MSDLAERFFAKVRKGDGCWEWTAARNPKGYGTFGIGVRRTSPAHRVSWRLHFGEIPDGMCVCHRCDNPGCVRPDHLFLGTNDDNQADKVAKGRAARMRGELSGKAKLTEEDVRLIRLAVDTLPVSHVDVGRAFGITSVNVRHIIRRLTWSHIQ